MSFKKKKLLTLLIGIIVMLVLCLDINNSNNIDTNNRKIVRVYNNTFSKQTMMRNERYQILKIAERKRQLEEEARRLAAEEEAKRLAEEEAKRLAEEEAKRLAEEEAKRLAEEEEAKRLAEEEEARRLAEEEEARRLAEEEEARRLAEEAMQREMVYEEQPEIEYYEQQPVYEEPNYVENGNVIECIFEVSFYTTAPDEGSGTGIGASGEYVQPWVSIALPPDIPFYSTATIEGLGTFINHDTGSYIQWAGYDAETGLPICRADICVSTKEEAFSWGRFYSKGFIVLN